MNFNYRAVSKKDRIKKTLLFGIPLSIGAGIVGSFAIMLSQVITFNVVYYAVILSIGYIIGVMVKKIGKGTTVEFLIIAGALALLSILIAIYFTFVFKGIFLPLDYFFIHVVANLPGMASFSFVEILFGVAVAVLQANTVQIR